MKDSQYHLLFYGYPTSVWKESPRVNKVAGMLAGKIKDFEDRCGKPKEYILVAHSMGGLVAKEYILNFLGPAGRAGDLRVTQLILIAVPNTGSELAVLLDMLPFVPKHQPRNLLPTQENPWLYKQHRDWQAYVLGEATDAPPGYVKAVRVDTMYAREDAIVTTKSAVDRFYWMAEFREERVCSYSTKVYGHINIVKPDCPEDPVVNEVIERIKQHAFSQTKRMPWELNREDRLLYERGQAFLSKKRWPEAAMFFHRLHHKYPKSNHPIHYYYAKALWGNFQSAEAIKEYEHALTIYKGDASTWYNLAYAYKVNDEYKKAKARVLEALKLKPLHTKARSLLASLLVRQAKQFQDEGKTVEATTVWDEAERAYRVIWNPRKYLEKEYSELTKEGREEWQAALGPEGRLFGAHTARYQLARVHLMRAPQSRDAIEMAIEDIEEALRYAASYQKHHPASFRELAVTLCRDGKKSENSLFRLQTNEAFLQVINKYTDRIDFKACKVKGNTVHTAH